MICIDTSCLNLFKNGSEREMFHGNDSHSGIMSEAGSGAMDKLTIRKKLSTISRTLRSWPFSLSLMCNDMLASVAAWAGVLLGRFLDDLLSFAPHPWLLLVFSLLRCRSSNQGFAQHFQEDMEK